MVELTVYEKPTCTTCRNLAALLEERGIDFERVNYHVDPLPEAKIRELVRKTGGPAADLLRKREPAYKEHVEGRDLSDDDIIRLMAEGRSNHAIAETMVVTERAVEKHVTSIFSKLDLTNTPEDHRRVLAVLAYLRT